MCKFKLFSIAAAALMMVACSTEDLTQQTQTKAGKMQFSATIAAPSSGATTRTEYSESDGDINVAWKVGDEIALVHNGVKDVATVKTINSDGSATITGYVTRATNGADVSLVYPAAFVKTATGNENYTPDPDLLENLKKQDGTLAYIQDNLDFRSDMNQLSVEGDKATLAYPAEDMAAELAIWKLTLQDDAETPAALSATQVKIKGGSSVLASTTTLTAGTSVVTLAMPTNLSVVGALTIEATVGDDTYAYTKTGVSFNPGKYYQSTVTMEKKAANAYLKWDNTKKELVATPMPDTYTTVTSSNTDVDWAAGTYVVEGDVEINDNITLTGDVKLIIKDGAKLTAKQISGNSKNLSIYGQANQSGQLVVNCSSASAILSITTLEVHSCKVKATSSYGLGGGFNGIGTFNVYGGSVDAEGTNTGEGGYGILLASGGTMNIYGGDVTAVGKGGDSTYSYGIRTYYGGGSASVIVYGGKLRAECAGRKAFYIPKVTLTKDAGYTSGKIQTCDDGSSWADYTGATTPETKYVRVGY